METVTLLYIIIAVFIALFLAVFQYIYKRKEKGPLNYWLSFLRFLSLFSIFLLIINPSIEKKTIEVEKPSLLVAIDNSKSIDYNSQNEAIFNLANKLKEDKALNSKFNITYYSFGKEIKLLDSLNFTENQTSISKPIQEFSKIYTTGVNPVIIATDGNQTVGNSVEFLNYKYPVFPFIVGDTSTIDDIYINRLNVNNYTFIKNKFPVEIFVNYVGSKTLTKNLDIFHKGKKIATQPLQFSKTKNVQTASFYVTGDESGTQYFTAQIAKLENELNTVNNTKSFSINVVEEKSDILILTSTIHPDLGMLKKSIESNKQRSVTIKNIDLFKSNIIDYQLVILYQPNKKFKEVLNSVISKKLNFLIISGNSTDWNFLNENQQFFKKEIITAIENYVPVFNVNYESFKPTDIGFSSFAPLENGFGNITFSVPYQTLLFQKIGVIETEQPMLATFEIENQKGGVLLGENSWRWRMNSFVENKTFELFDGFMANLMQYLASDFKSERLSATVNPLFFSNETIQVSASYLDKNLNLDSRAKLWLTVANKENNYVNKIPFALVNTSFMAELSNIPAAEYTYTVSVENTLESSSGKFKVLPFEMEQQFSQSNHKELEKLALKTQGKVYYTNQESELIASLLDDQRFKSIQKSVILKTPLIDWEWILGFIILLLSLEWFTRKYYGEI